MVPVGVREGRPLGFREERGHRSAQAETLDVLETAREGPAHDVGGNPEARGVLLTAEGDAGTVFTGREGNLIVLIMEHLVRNAAEATPPGRQVVMRFDAEPKARVFRVRDEGPGIPEAKRGLVAAAGGVMMLPDQIPERVAMELALTGDFIGAERAYQIGLINEVTEGPALDGAKALAARIAANGPLAVRVSKQIMKESRGWAMEDRYKKQAQLIGPVFVSEDAREGSLAFAEKRKPNWKGK